MITYGGQMDNNQWQTTSDNKQAADSVDKSWEYGKKAYECSSSLNKRDSNIPTAITNEQTIQL